MKAQLNNKERLNLLEQLASEREKNAVAKERVQHFIAGFDICAENRNFLMHSMTHKASWDKAKTEYMTLRKAPRREPHRVNYLNLELTDLRRIAEEISDYDEYAISLFVWLQAQPLGRYFWADGTETTPTLPDKPPTPIDVSSLLRPTPPDENDQPQSSAPK